MSTVYILQCYDNSYYVGKTIDIDRRFVEHSIGEGALYTKHRRPVKLVYSEQIDNDYKAYKRELQLKGWSRKKKEALINGNFDLLREHARNKNKL
jgi:putative endonuclease